MAEENVFCIPGLRLLILSYAIDPICILCKKKIVYNSKFSSMNNNRVHWECAWRSWQWNINTILTPPRYLREPRTL